MAPAAAAAASLRAPLSAPAPLAETGQARSGTAAPRRGRSHDPPRRGVCGGQRPARGSRLHPAPSERRKTRPGPHAPAPPAHRAPLGRTAPAVFTRLAERPSGPGPVARADPAPAPPRSRPRPLPGPALGPGPASPGAWPSRRVPGARRGLSCPCGAAGTPASDRTGAWQLLGAVAHLLGGHLFPCSVGSPVSRFRL